MSINLNSTTPLKKINGGGAGVHLSGKVLANMLKTMGSIPRTRREEDT